MKICAFGDSLTYAGYTQKSWVNLLRKYLKTTISQDIELINLGINGNTSEDILKRFQKECKSINPEIIVFAYGINDSSYILEKTQHLVDIENFEKNTKELIKQAKEFTDKVIFIGLVLGDDTQLKPYHESKRGKKVFDRKNAQKYDHVVEKTAKENVCDYVYLFDKLDFSDFDDGLHPNDNGHKKMYEVIKNHFFPTK